MPPKSNPHAKANKPKRAKKTPPAQPKAAPLGRPSDYTEAMGLQICDAIADGQSLRSICAAPGMPSKTSVFRWLAANPIFRDHYASARETQADTIFDEILDIADDGANDWMERERDGHKTWVENGEALRRSQIRIDARKWMAGKLRPKKYGDKITQEHVGKDGGAIEHRDVSARDRIASRIARIAANSGAGPDTGEPVG